MTATPAALTVEPAPGGVVLRAVADGRDVTLWLQRPDALTLADEITMLCEIRVCREGVAA